MELKTKIEVVDLFVNKAFTATELSSMYGIARKTVYAWFHNYMDNNFQSRRPLKYKKKFLIIKIPCELLLNHKVIIVQNDSTLRVL